MKNCVIYCRVSTDKQMQTGHGIDSQEQRCKEYADKYEYNLIGVFRDEGVSGSLESRPGIKELLLFISANKNTTVIIDDQKRLARDIKVYLLLKESIKKLGCQIVYLNHTFESTPEGNFIETILASAAQLEREQMARQTRQKMEARIKSGYWVFQPPLGYEFKKVEDNKQLVFKQPQADILRQALIDFSTGKIKTQVDILENLKNQKISVKKSSIIDLLKNKIYIGILEVPKWELFGIAGKHEPLISFDIYEDNQKRIGNKFIARASESEADFPLRGLLKCSICAKQIRGGWTKGGKYGYYYCQNKNCPQYWKTETKEKMENAILSFLKAKSLRPTTIKIMREVLDDRIEDYILNERKLAETTKKELEKIQESTEIFLDKIVKSKNDTLTELYEKSLVELQEQKIKLEFKLKIQQSESNETGASSVRTAFDKVMEFAKNLDSIYINGDLEQKRNLLELVFGGNLIWDKKEGVRTTTFADSYAPLQAVSLSVFTDGGP